MSTSPVIYVTAEGYIGYKIFDFKKNVSQITTKTFYKKL
jgi:hypothetical protein